MFRVEPSPERTTQPLWWLNDVVQFDPWEFVVADGIRFEVRFDEERWRSITHGTMRMVKIRH